jgi:hypothetical protein
MSNELTLGTAASPGSARDLRAYEVFNSLIHENLVDRTDLRQTLMRLGDVGGSGSDTLTTPKVSFDDPMAAASADEVTPSGNTALAVGQTSIAVAHQILAYGLTDKFMITGGPGNLGVQQLAAKMADAYILRLTDLVCTAAESFSNDVTATSTMDVDTFFDGIGQLEQSSVPGPYFCLLHHNQWVELQSSLRSESNTTIAFNPATPEQIAIRGAGYAGDLYGVAVYQCDSVTTDASKYNGAMYGMGALAYVEASPRQAMPGSMAALVTPAGSPVYAEFDRDADPGISRIVGHAFCGVSILEDARGTGLLSDA